MEEIWKVITNYNGLYKVSNMGRIKVASRKIPCGRSNKTFIYKEKILTQSHTKQNYLRVYLNAPSSKRKMHLVHRLVAKNFIPNPKNKPQVNHKNGIKTDNRVENLEWVTDQENKNHAVVNNLTLSGEKHLSAKLTWKEVLEIRKKYKRYIYTIPMLAKEYNVGVSAIDKIVYHKSWTH